MKTKIKILAQFFLILNFSFLTNKIWSQQLQNNASSTMQNVILITVDGVRFQEMFYGVRFPLKAHEKLGTELLPGLKTLEHTGEAISFRHMFVANPVAVSLPGYRSILSGEYESSCDANNCTNTTRRTIFDDLYDQGFSKVNLAVFGSWNTISYATESVPGRIVQNVQQHEYWESNLTMDEMLQLSAINTEMLKNPPPWGVSRYDKYTFALAKFYLKKHRPRFLYLQMGDTDEYGHHKDYKNYIQAIRTLDQQVAEIRNMLHGLGEYGDHTSIVITTDHGRGSSFMWPHHSREILSAHFVWAYVLPAQNLLASKKIAYKNTQLKSHLDIRPTLEYLLGLEPKSGPFNRGSTLVKLVE